MSAPNAPIGLMHRPCFTSELDERRSADLVSGPCYTLIYCESQLLEQRYRILIENMKNVCVYVHDRNSRVREETDQSWTRARTEGRPDKGTVGRTIGTFQLPDFLRRLMKRLVTSLELLLNFDVKTHALATTRGRPRQKSQSNPPTVEPNCHLFKQ